MNKNSCIPEDTILEPGPKLLEVDSTRLYSIMNANGSNRVRSRRQVARHVAVANRR